MAGKMRSLDEVSTVIDYAKLNENELKTIYQSLWIKEDFKNDDIILFELDEKLLEYANTGERFVIRGHPNDHAVLCTKNETYEIKEAETSNSLLLVPEITWAEDIAEEGEKSLSTTEIAAIHHKYFELRSCKPRLKKLQEILELNPYSGQEYEKDNNEKKYSIPELLNEVQASEEELQAGLKHIQAFLIDGFWRLLDFDYKARVLIQILDFIEENSWSHTQFPLKTIVDVLEELEPKEILQQCIEYYGVLLKEKDESGSELYALDCKKICQFHAEILLRSAGRFNLAEFFEAWQKSVPEGMVTDPGQLQGMALIDRTNKPEVIWHFPVSNLPQDVQERFNVLFTTREKWTYDDIQPYILDLTTSQLNVNALLTKFSRSIVIKGVRYYNAK